MPPTNPRKTVPKRASRVEDDTQEQRPRTRRRLSTGSAESLEQESTTNDTPGSRIGHDKSTAEEEMPAAYSPRGAERRSRDPGSQQPPGNQHSPTQGQVDLIPSWITKRYTESPVAPPLPSVMAKKYRLWKDDLDFVAGRGLYWGTAAPRQAGWRLDSHQSAENGEEQVRVKRHKYPSCAPCLERGRQCSKERPICAQCRSKDGVASSSKDIPAVCSYPIDRAFMPDSERRYSRGMINPKRKKTLDTNLAVTLEHQYSGLYVSEDDNTLNEDGPSNNGIPTDGPSNDGSWKVGAQGEHDLDEEPEVAIRESARSEWLAKALFAEDEDREYYTTTIPKKLGPTWVVQEEGEAPVKIRRPMGRPRKVRTEEELVKVRRPVGRPRKVRTEDELVKVRRPVGRPRKLRTEEEPVKVRRPVGRSRKELAHHESDESHKRVESASQKGKDTKKAKLKAKLKVKSKAKSKDRDKDNGVPALRRREFSRQAMVKYLKDTTRKLNALSTWTEGPTTPTGYQEQEEIEVIVEDGVEDACRMETTTPVIPKYKQQIASTFRPWVAQKDEKVHLSVCVQEIISDFAYKLGRDSQLEDIQVKVDKLVAAQHGDKWEENFLEYLESRTSVESLSRKESSRKWRDSGAEDGPAESADESGLDPELSEDNNTSHGPQLWDELEELRRTTPSLGVGTVKELVNRTNFNFSKDGALELFEETHLDQEETGRRLSMSSLHTDSDSDSSDNSDTDLTTAGYGDKLMDSILRASKETPFRKVFDSDSETGLTDEEDTEILVRNSTRSVAGGSEAGSIDQDDDNDMPEIDFSPSILTQLSNSRFGSQPVFGQDDSSSHDDGFDGSAGPAMARSQVIQDASNESSEAEAEEANTESDSEQEKATAQKEDKMYKKEKGEKGEKEESEKDSDPNEDEHTQEDDYYDAFQDDDFSPSVLTQVSATRFGSAFKLNQDDSSSGEDDVLNNSSGRFLVQSQVVQDDSDDGSSEVQEDSSSSDSEQEEDDDEEKDSVATKDKMDNTTIKEDRVEDDDEREEGEVKEEDDGPESIELPEHLAERAIEESDEEMELVEEEDRAGAGDSTGTREQSRAGSEADMDVEPVEEYKATEALSEEDQGEPSQPIVTTVRATRFGSQFSASYNVDDDDESEEDGTFYGGTQSQVVYDDSTSEEENVQESSESDED
ncbi:hypothetical protein BGZ96_008588 [Linnemannia gamsii]|uniref:Zn(2)-C6 fungal-type domain-containing protein n=1 Tax=Linnemannia gamsii TaxID=64522 RepID=A0ABQ7JZZ0_9FUNG|nr:hypothetical protein BGZ96_008588 [Linnemannia gamsii]